MSEKTKVIIVVGPTASGKTALGVNIARHFNGEVISADSMQIYNNMPIASAAPTTDEMQGIPHHLIGFANADERFSVAEYIPLAESAISKTVENNHLPIIVGGTGLYIDSLVNGIRFNDEENSGIKSDIRARLEAEADRFGMEKMYLKLTKTDPKAAQKLHINDRKRVLRALEMHELHGKTKTDLEAESIKAADKYDALWIGITYKNRDALYDRINRRVDIMLKNGLLEEARKSFESSVGSTAVQAIGHKEFFEHFSGNCSLEQCVENLKASTRRYAKRQLTWFRKNDKINWIYADETDSVFESAKEIILKFLTD